MSVLSVPGGPYVRRYVLGNGQTTRSTVGISASGGRVVNGGTTMGGTIVVACIGRGEGSAESEIFFGDASDCP